MVFRLCLIALMMSSGAAFANDAPLKLIETININSFFAGMLLVALVQSLLRKKSPVSRFMEVGYGVLGLAVLAFNSFWLLAALPILLLAHIYYGLRGPKDVGLMVAIASVPLVILMVLLLAVYSGLSPQYLLIWPVYLLLVPPFRVLALSKLANPPGEVSSAAQNDAVMPDRSWLREAYTQHQTNYSGPATLVVFRLQGFAELQQKLGHDFADILLVQIARKVNHILAAETVMPVTNANSAQHAPSLNGVYLAHLGEMDFAFVVEGQVQKHLHEQLIDAINLAVAKPINVHNCTVDLSLKFAYAQTPNLAEEPFEGFLSHVYLALLQNDHDSVTEYHNELCEMMAHQRERVAELSELNFEQVFELHFQPVVAIKSNQVEFIELLLRWPHESRGMLSAQTFIEDVRLAGLANKVARWVVEQACQMRKALREAGNSTPISINLFGKELLQDDFIEYLDHTITEHKIAKNMLIIECPISTFMELEDGGAAVIRRLRSMGIKVCVDDLGATPVSLAVLPKLHFDYVKVDQSLTTELAKNVNSRSLLGGIVDMNNNLNAKVICEGIESQEVLEYIEGLKVFGAQGYLFSRPLDLNGAASWLAQWQHKLNEGNRPY